MLGPWSYRPYPVASFTHCSKLHPIFWVKQHLHAWLIWSANFSDHVNTRINLKDLVYSRLLWVVEKIATLPFSSFNITWVHSWSIYVARNKNIVLLINMFELIPFHSFFCGHAGARTELKNNADKIHLFVWATEAKVFTIVVYDTAWIKTNILVLPNLHVGVTT